ncbi:MAG: response regulator [Spirochaetales bacterium]|nr:response regulator [Spirochaetales bacterium]
MDSLLTLIIIDDERIIREGLRDMVDWHQLGFHVEGCFDDGKDALDYLAKQPVDAVLTDIKMDDISGIAVSQYIADNLPDTKVVVLSGYRDFSYAQQAVKYKVLRYLIKPVDFRELESAFTDIKKMIDEERGGTEAARHDGTQWKELLPLARRQFFADLAAGRILDPEQINERFKQLELQLSPELNPCSLIRMTIRIDAETLSESAHLGVLRAITAEIDSSLWYEIQYFDNRLIVLAVSTSHLSVEKFEPALTQRVREVCLMVRTVFQVDLDFEVLASFSGLLSLAQSRSAALLEDGALGGPPAKPDNAYRDPIIERVLKYLNENYGPNVSLSSAAEMAYLSPVYFSKYIREHTGRTFTEHLTAVRIQKAIELLRKNKHPIGRIGAIVGYPNPRYFSRVFRKQTGYGPREYRMQVIAGEPSDE